MAGSPQWCSAGMDETSPDLQRTKREWQISRDGGKSTQFSAKTTETSLNKQSGGGKSVGLAGNPQRFQQFPREIGLLGENP